MEKQNIKKEIRLKDLPPHLQNKYKNSILFQKENAKKAKKFQFDMKKLKQRKAQKEKTIQQKLEEFKINPTQQKYLLKVFQNLVAINGQQKKNQQYFTASDISQILRKMEIKMTSSDIDLMIWQFDENLNKRISKKEFINMYKKCTMDRSGSQPKNLFHLTQFMMYCRPNYYRITVEDTLELLYVRAKKQAQINRSLDEKVLLQEQIKVIFGQQEKTPQGVQKQIGFKQYLEKINKRAIEKRIEELQKSRIQFKY